MYNFNITLLYTVRYILHDEHHNYNDHCIIMYHLYLPCICKHLAQTREYKRTQVATGFE